MSERQRLTSVTDSPWIDAELGVIGSLLVWPENLAEVAVILRPDDFLHPQCKALFEAMLDTDLVVKNGNKEEIYATRVWNRLFEKGRGDFVAKAFIAQLMQDSVHSTTAVDYCQVIIRWGRARAMREVFQKASSEIEMAAELSDESLAAWESKIHEYAANRLSRTPLEANALMRKLGEILDSPAPEASITTGLLDLDRDSDLFEPGAFTVIAGRPSMGKSTLMRNLVHHISPNYSTLVFSLEESKEMFSTKLACSLAKLPYKKVSRRELSEIDRQRVLLAMGMVSEYKLRTSDDCLSTREIIGAIKMLRAKSQPPRVVLIDHFQAMHHERTKGENDVSMYTRTVHKLARAAVENNCAIVLFCQLNRNCEYRTEPRPYLSDLRDTGALEQAAWNALFIWAEDRKEPHRYIYVAKQRNGPTFEVKLYFDGEYGLFGNSVKEGL